MTEETPQIERSCDLTEEIEYQISNIITQSREYVPHHYAHLIPIENSGQKVEMDRGSNEPFGEQNHDALPIANVNFSSQNTINTEEVTTHPSERMEGDIQPSLQHQFMPHHFDVSQQRRGNNLLAIASPQMEKCIEQKHVPLTESILKNIPSLPEYVGLHVKRVEADDKYSGVLQSQNQTVQPLIEMIKQRYEDVSPPDSHPQTETFIGSINKISPSNSATSNDNFQLLPCDVVRNNTVIQNIEQIKYAQSLEIDQPNIVTRPSLNMTVPSVPNMNIGNYDNESVQTSQPKLKDPIFDFYRHKYEFLTRSNEITTDSTKNTRRSEPADCAVVAQLENLKNEFETPQQKFAHHFGLNQQKYQRMAQSNSISFSYTPPYVAYNTDNVRPRQPSSSNRPTLQRDPRKAPYRHLHSTARPGRPSKKYPSSPARGMQAYQAPPPPPPPPPPTNCIPLQNPTNLHQPVMPFNHMNYQCQQQCHHPVGMHHHYCGHLPPTNYCMIQQPDSMSEEQLLHHIGMHYRSYEYLSSVLWTKRQQH